MIRDLYPHGSHEILQQNEIYLAFKAGIISQREVWLLTGNYKLLKEMPDAETNLSLDIKSDLSIQRLLSRPHFRGVVANKPVTVSREFPGIYLNTID